MIKDIIRLSPVLEKYDYYQLALSETTLIFIVLPTVITTACSYVQGLLAGYVQEKRMGRKMVGFRRVLFV